MGIFGDIFDGFKSIGETIGSGVKGVFGTISDNVIKPVLGAGVQVVGTVGNTLGSAVGTVGNLGGKVLDTAGGLANRGLDIVQKPFDIISSPIFLIGAGIIAVIVLPKLLDRV